MSRQIGSLTGIRGVAALWVALFHSKLVFHLPTTWWTPPIEQGWAGVDLFFVLSGFILMHAHGEDFVQVSSAACQRFLRGRVVRVYPLNLVVLLGIVAITHGGQGVALIPDTQHFIAAFLATATLLTMWLPENWTLNPPVWSLSAELVGYLAFPALAHGLMRLRLSSAVVAAISFAVMVWLRASLHQAHIAQIEGWGALIRLAGCFVGGVALWRLRSVLPDSWARLAGPLAATSLAGIVVCSVFYGWSEALPALFGVLIISLSYQRGWVARALAHRGLYGLGVVSFPFYLTHLWGLDWFRATYPTDDLSLKIGLIVASLLTTLGLAVLLHLWVEVPCQRFGRARRLGIAGRSGGGI
ncbi:MAG: acyltransferase [Alphaproteobacteria bacterium]|nr:MAG: acyltransferase [Alphaproteobacteria bacterium]